MNTFIRSFGWLLLGIGSLLTLVGIIALPGWIQVRVDSFGLDLDTIQEWIAWIMCWLVTVITGGLLVGLTNPKRRLKKAVND